MKKNIYLMYAISFLQGMVFYSSISTLYRQAYGVTAAQMMLLEAVSFLVTLALEVPWGILADRIGYKKTMIGCTILFAVQKVIFWQATGFFHFLIERILMGVTGAGLSGVDTSILYLSCGEEDSQKVFGIHSSVGTAGVLTATVIFSTLLKENYRMAAFLTVLTYSAAAVLPFFLTEVKGEKERRGSWAETKDSLLQVLRRPSLLLFLFGSALIGEMVWVSAGFLNQLQYEKCGMSVSAIGYVFAVATVLELAGAFSHRVTKWLGQKTTLFLLGAVPMAACAFLAVTNRPWISVAAELSIVLAYALWAPLVGILENKQVQGNNRATVLSVVSMIGSSVTVAVDLGVGVLTDISIATAFLSAAFLSALGLGMLLVWYRINRKQVIL